LQTSVHIKAGTLYIASQELPKAPRCSMTCRNGGCTGQTGACFGVCYCHGVCI